MAAQDQQDLAGYYATTVKMPRSTEEALKREQAKRFLNTKKTISINALASELLTDWAEKQPQ